MRPESRAALDALREAFVPIEICEEMVRDPTNRWDNLRGLAEPSVALVGLRWTEIPDAMLEASPDLLIVAGPAVFGQLVPAYISFLLREAGDLVGVVHVLIEELRAPTSQRSMERHQRRFSAMSPVQLAAIRDALMVLATRGKVSSSIREAIDGLP